jgi:NADH-quinone oxidoreductase subunit J
MYPFEIAAVILVIGIIAAIGLTLRTRPSSKKQNPSKQVLATKADRLKVVQIESEEALNVK